MFPCVRTFSPKISSVSARSGFQDINVLERSKENTLHLLVDDTMLSRSHIARTKLNRHGWPPSPFIGFKLPYTSNLNASMGTHLLPEHFERVSEIGVPKHIADRPLGPIACPAFTQTVFEVVLRKSTPKKIDNLSFTILSIKNKGSHHQPSELD